MSDLISRQAAIDALEERLRANGYGNVALVSELNRSIGYIMRLPSADPVKHGRWIDDYNADEFPFFRNGWKCSACGSRNTYGKPKYCMNCGAQMDGESNEMD